ncbi:hypothetical protein [Rhodococcoides yunnanense]|uniref:hypothetical protein n=1 Tax=Rhodococcoides yunnanense TaxID=278209 RepID=UPI00093433BB|nr:hypothetical protein [Rhodococcus yunnanensis]
MGSAAFAEVMESQARDYVDFGATFSAATAAGAAGIGPKIFISDADSAVLVMEDFTGADVKWGLWGCVNHKLSDAWDFDCHKSAAVASTAATT